DLELDESMRTRPAEETRDGGSGDAQLLGDLGSGEPQVVVHARHLERVLEELIVDVGSSHDQGAMSATKEARSSPRPFTTRSAVRSLAARSDRVASPVSVSTAVKPLSFAMRTSVYNLSPTNVTGGPVVAPDHRRCLMVSAMAVLGFPSTVGVR